MFLFAQAASASAGDDAGGATPSVQASGWFAADYFRSDNHLDNRTDFAGAALDIKLKATLTDKLGAQFEARAIAPDLGRNSNSDSALIEGFLSWQDDQWRIRLGKQIVAWGRADGLNPTDNLTPHDYVVMLPFEEDQRTGTIALTADVALDSDYSLSMFATPFFNPTRIPLPLGQAEFVNQSSRSGVEGGLRLNRTGGQFDWSLSYFHGYDLFPVLRPIEFGPPLPVIALTYPQADVLGADFAFNAGRFGVRGEFAYHHVGAAVPGDPLARHSYWYGVLGADRSFDDNLNINLQVFGRAIEDYADPATSAPAAERPLAVLDAIIGGQQDRHTYGFTARVAKTWLNDTLKAEVLAVANRTRRDFYLRPLLSYDANDHTRLSAGVNLYRGPIDSFFGRLAGNSGAFAQARFSF
ncbi:MAG TPA: DUF1302 family protein [Burkholderiaceae bacterium]|jgi:hypothetical protein